jgi:hypothetical protein
MLRFKASFGGTWPNHSRVGGPQLKKACTPLVNAGILHHIQIFQWTVFLIRISVNSLAF